MKRIAALILIAAAARADVPTLRWDIETARPSAQLIEVFRHETVIFDVRYLNYGAPLSLADAWDVVLRYRSADMPEDFYYAATGAVVNASAGLVRVIWTPEAVGHTNSYVYTLAAKTVGGDIMRGLGAIRVRNVVQGSVTNMPRAVTTSFDWSSVEHINIGSAPFLSDADILSLENAIAALTTGKVDRSEWASTNAAIDADILSLENAIAALNTGKVDRSEWASTNAAIYALISGIEVGGGGPTTLAGDVSGPSTNATVIGLRGVPVSLMTDPQNGHALKYDAATQSLMLGPVIYADAAGTASSVSLFALGTNAMTPEAYAAFTAGGGGGITPQDVASIVVTSHVASASSVTNEGAQMFLTGGGIKLALTNYLATAYDIRDPEWVYAEELNFRDPLEGNMLTLRGTSMVRSNDFWTLLYEYPYGAYGQGFTAEYAAKVDWSGITNVPPVTWESVTNKPGLLESDVPGSGAYTVGTLGVLGSIRGSGATTMDVVPELVPVSGQVGVADHWWLSYAGIRLGSSERVVTAFGPSLTLDAGGVLGAESGYPAPLAVTVATTTNVMQWGYATNHFEIVHTNGTLYITNLWADAPHAQYSMVYLHNSNAQPFSVQGLDYWNSNGCEIAAMPPLNKYNKLMFEKDARGIRTGYVLSTNTVSK